MSEPEIFMRALDLPEGPERAAFLETACGSDAALQSRITELLHAHEHNASILHHSPALIPGLISDTQTVESAKADSWELLKAFLAPAQRQDSLGRLAHYEILKVIGEGGFGIVLKAFDDSLHRLVAIKVLHPNLAKTSPPRKRFLREACAAAAVKHEYVVQIYSVEEQPLPYIVMEYVEGQSLQDCMNATGPFDSVEIVRLGRQIALGLAAAHEKGLIHRDIKPANLLLENGVESKIKLTDFGLARTNDAASITQSGLIVGTPLYMSPEQVGGEPLDTRSDLFSLGSVLYALCVGHPPFRARTMLAVMKRVADDEPRPIQDIIPEVPSGLVTIIQKLLQKKPENRFTSAAEVAKSLENCLTAEPVPRWKVKRRFILAWVAVAFSMILGFGFVFWPRTPTNTDLIIPPKNETPPKLTWEQETASLPLARQIEAVKAKLHEANPQFDLAKMELKTLDGAVAEINFNSVANLYDLRPLRGFPKLRWLEVCTYDGQPDMKTLSGLPLTHLDTNGLKFRDLSPLIGMKLEFFNLWASGTDSLAPLAGMPIRSMNCGASEVKDLTPLVGMPLEAITINMTPVEDLTPLSTLPLTNILLQKTKVRNLEPLVNLKLAKLALNGSPIADYSPLAQIKTLEHLSLDYDPAKHEKLLRGLPNLKTINEIPADEFLNKTTTLDLLPEPEWLDSVKKLPEADRWPKIIARLKALNPKWNAEKSKSTLTLEGKKVLGYGIIDGTDLVDISPVKALPDITFVNMTGPKDYDLEAFRGFKLTAIYGNYTARQPGNIDALTGMPLRSLSLVYYRGSWEPVRKMSLEELRADSSSLDDLTILANSPIRILALSNAPVSNLAPLDGKPLEELYIRGTKIRDITLLAKFTKLRKLDIYNLPIKDLTPIQNLPIEDLCLNYDASQHRELLLKMPKLKNICSQPAAEVLGIVDSFAALPDNEWLTKVKKLPELDRWPFIEARLKMINPKWSNPEKKSGIHQREMTGIRLENCELITDASPLKALPEIKFISLNSRPSFSFDVFKGFKLEGIYLDSATPRDLSPLTGQPIRVAWLIGYQGQWDALSSAPLTELFADSSSLVDLSMFKQAKFTILRVDGTKVTNLTPVAGMPLDRLYISNTPVTDLSPLANCATLKHLRMLDCKVEDISPLSKLSLETIAIDYDAKKHEKVLRGITTLKIINDQPAKQFLDSNK